jgi:DNA-directed RNA polymerase subunit RPC12/RpoP
MRKSMIAYHGSKNFDCGKIDADYEGRWGSAMFFSFDPSLAREFSRGAELKHICTYEIPHSFSELFDPEDEYAVDALRDCLDTSIENKPLIDDIIKGVRSFDWAAFTPSSWIGQEIKTCLQGMGYVGWLEKEHGDDSLNFGLYSAEGVRLLNVEYFCDECDEALSKKEDHTLECEDCNLRLCVECGSEIEWDNDVSEWVWTCMCEEQRENPTVYHGGDVEVQALDPVWMAHDGANQQEGVGIYFTTNIETAKRYGPKVIETYIDLEDFVPSRDLVEEYFTQDQIAELIYEIGRKSSKEDMYYFITNWFEFPVNTRIDMNTAYVLAGNYMDTEIRYLQNELVEIDKEAFIEAWNETLGVKGTYHHVTDDEVWVAIIDPEVTVTYVA